VHDDSWLVEIDSHGNWLFEHLDHTGKVAPPTSLNVTQAIVENPDADEKRRRGHLWCPACGTYWRVWEHSRIAKQYAAPPSVYLASREGVAASARYRRSSIRDIDRIIAAARERLPDLLVEQHQQSWPADDDGLWFFFLPGIAKDIQLESPFGVCPFIVEHSDMKSSTDAQTARSAEEAAEKVVTYLMRQKEEAGSQ
jgi:hypothetical protein